MNIEEELSSAAASALGKLYGASVDAASIQVNATRKDQKGDYTIVTFPLLKISKKTPEATGEELAAELKAALPDLIASHEVIKGFLNITLSANYWAGILNNAAEDADYGYVAAKEDSPLVMIEYSSPNTNKPLHLGHIRNILLGHSLSQILAANGNRVVKTNIVNDRGIHICKSMLAWKHWFDGATPATSGKKGDHLVGDCYVRFDKEYKAQVAALKADGMAEEEAEEKAPIMQEAREMLRKWEAEDKEVRELWGMMNEWVYAGFDETYKMLGVGFDKIYYESQTYKVGRDLVLKGLEEGKFVREADGSVWADLTADGLDKKILLRKDGTSVYMTQDIGTAKMRFEDFDIDRMIYVVGNEQNYHFQVLSILLDRLGFKWGKDLVHFSYGMVELPEGRMKSREGTVVDADDLVAAMIETAKETSDEAGKLEGYTAEEAAAVHRILALGALKYFILKVDPRKTMTFNPKESIDFNGNTGPFVQYAHARIKSLLAKAEAQGFKPAEKAIATALEDKEIQLLRHVEKFPRVVAEAGKALSPALIANFAYDLAKEYNQFYHDYPILREADADKRANRLLLSSVVAHVIANAMKLLGIEVPERM